MAPPQYLTVRNLAPHTLTILSLERFAIPQQPTLKNITNLNNITRNLSNIFKKTPLKDVPLPQFPSLDNAKVAPGAQAAHSEQVQIQIAPFSTLGGDQSKIKIFKDGPNEILRITFKTNVEGKWSVDVNPNSGVVSKDLVHYAGPGVNTGEDYTAAIWHIAQSHLALVWTPPLNKWQSVLPMTLPLSAFSTPGTHNSPTHYVAAPSVRCQSNSVAIQLANGIRFLDIRAQPEQKGDNAWLVHGKFPISLTGIHLLTSLFDDVYKFLAANSSEVVMISLKREGPFDVPDETFSKILHDKIIAPHAANWYTSPEIPTLQQAKGKCVLIRRFNLHPDLKDWGIDAHTWKYNTPNDTSPSGKIQVQDFSEVLAAENVGQKIGYVQEHIVRAAALNFVKSSVATYPIFLNFLSGSNFWNIKAWPEGVSDKVTPAIAEYLAIKHNSTSQDGDNGTGVLVADYVGDKADWSLMKLIVAMNGIIAWRIAEKKKAEQKK